MSTILAKAVELLGVTVTISDPYLRANNSLIFLSINPSGM
jgi:hypothetical protein